MTRALLLVLTLLGLSACAADIGAPDAHGVCPLIRFATLPLEAHRNLLFVQAGINGVPVRLLLDTGAERTLLTETAVKRLELPRDKQHVTRTFGIGDPTASWDALLPNGLMLGSTHFPVDSVSVGRFDISQGGEMTADGLLGADILLAFDMDLDLPHGRLTLYRARRACPQAGPPWTEPYIAITGTLTQRDRLMVPFQLDGVSGMGVLDTGAQRSTVSLGMLSRLGLTESDLAEDKTVMAHGAAPNQVPVRLHRFRDLRIGGAVAQRPLLPVVPMLQSMGDALVGADFLEGRRVWLSFATHQIFMTPVATRAAIAAAP